MDVKHYPPRKRTHVTRGKYQRDLGICFLLTLVFLAILVFVTLAFGQEHPFPFKTLAEIEVGTAAWPLNAGPIVRGYCDPQTKKPVYAYWFESGAGSRWVVYTDKERLAAAYFVPGTQIPIVVVLGHTVDGKVVVERYVAVTEPQGICVRLNERSA